MSSRTTSLTGSITTARPNGHEAFGPIYRRVEQDLRSRIQNGHWHAGVMLPSRKALAQEYGVDLRTLQQAIAPLLQEGTLRADARRGTFVAEVLSGPASQTMPSPASIASPLQRAHSALALGIIADLSMPETGVFVKDQFKVRTAVHAMERTFSDAGATTHFFNLGRADGSTVPIREAITALTTERVNGIGIVFHDEPGAVEETVATVGRAPLPLVYVTSRVLEAPFPHVFYDSWDAGYQAAQHLIERGYRDVLFFAPFTEDWVEARLAGARAAVRHAGLLPHVLQACPSERPPRLGADQFEAGCRAAPLALAAFKEAPTSMGVIAASDALACGLLRITDEAGLAAGADFGLVGFDDAAEARLRGLTSLRPPIEAMGHGAGRLLLDILQGKQVAMHVRLRSYLVPRASTRSLRHDPANADPAREGLLVM